MFLIADSGSTKTDWVLISNGEVIKRINTIGFNPYFQNKDQIANAIYAQLLPGIGSYVEGIKRIYYYGAGCSNPTNCKIVKQGISIHLGNAKIEVSHDLLAAARALCGNEKGIAGILGTGSNSCLYDGKEVVENVPSVGYLWGDHGSGARLGIKFLERYFNDQLPSELKTAFEEEGFHREKILDNVYKKSMPSKYLASISLFVGKHVDHEFMKNLLIENFSDFFTYQISKYTDSKTYPVNTVGSIGFIYRPFLESAAKKNGYQLGKVIKSPLEGLIEYHLQSSVKS